MEWLTVDYGIDYVHVVCITIVCWEAEYNYSDSNCKYVAYVCVCVHYYIMDTVPVKLK